MSVRHIVLGTVKVDTFVYLARRQERECVEFTCCMLPSLQTSLQKMSLTVVQASLLLHSRIAQSFLPTAIKFHYIFNLRDFSNVFQVSPAFSTHTRFNTIIVKLQIIVQNYNSDGQCETHQRQQNSSKDQKALGRVHTSAKARLFRIFHKITGFSLPRCQYSL